MVIPAPEADQLVTRERVALSKSGDNATGTSYHFPDSKEHVEKRECSPSGQMASIASLNKTNISSPVCLPNNGI